MSTHASARVLPTLATAALLALAPPPARAQGVGAAPSDVESLDAIMEAVYDAISGPPGPRDWDRFRSLFVEGARLIPTAAAEGGGFSHRVMSVEDYVGQAGPVLENRGFFEREIHRTMDRYGPVVQVFSTYESRNRAEDPEPFARGINSFQLLHDGTRWWVVTIYWFGETPSLPIPTQYLPAGG